MCGRFNLTANAAAIEEAFGLFGSPGDLTPRYNIAPTQQVLAVRQEDGKRAACRLRWGLVPFWADDLKIGYKLINARADGIATKPSFRDALKKRRCLIPVTGFYEWRTEGKAKMPFHIHRADGRPFVFAGLWERWTKGETPVESCTIVTTDANEFMAPLHTVRRQTGRDNGAPCPIVRSSETLYTFFRRARTWHSRNHSGRKVF
jgi:putative SOS response-associated peptidase YedK